MTLQQERRLLEAVRFCKWAWLVTGTIALVIGALTNRSPWWLLPMIMATIAEIAEGRQSRRVTELERKQP